MWRNLLSAVQSTSTNLLTTLAQRTLSALRLDLDKSEHNDGEEEDVASWGRRFEEALPEFRTKKDIDALKHMIRQGIPEAKYSNDEGITLRGAVWLQLIDLHTEPSPPSTIDDNKPTFTKKRRSSSFSKLGRTFAGLQSLELTAEQEQTLRLVLMGAAGEEHPAVPLITALMLREGLGLAQLQKILSMMLSGQSEEDPPYWYFPLTNRDLLVFRRVFEELLQKFSSGVARHVERLQELVPDWTPPWDRLLFGFLTPMYDHQSLGRRILDTLLVEGYKVLLRFALAHCIVRERLLLKARTPQSFDDAVLSLMTESRNADAQIVWRVAFDMGFSRRLVRKFRQRHRKTSLEDFDRRDLAAILREQRLPTLLSESLVMKDDDDGMWERVWSWVPVRFRLLALDVVYRRSRDGTSMRTFYDRCASHEPLLILLQTDDGDGKELVVGAYLSSSMTKRSSSAAHSNNRIGKLRPVFFGTGETFIFDATHGKSWRVPRQPRNHQYILAQEHTLAVGCADGRFGLWLGHGLSHVVMQACDTFEALTVDIIPHERPIRELELFRFVL